ncbi:hypothetical protein A2480_03880 [Candidatus Uhrbacteria bacterium RIFOXYC2_FULL_47_19]|uniref:Uncharacterized protein n=1 Tax=Candidatus Uhrbacteria bacterium RIFOXYC2_FULL_47_19 TaxID=1802424 RepID=A0A1F7WC38_9BACT|nr:MAG: hypothetical protein A2480_03880 [Candidatus Uhrbacteria bacterium RIFOXYC2_FULL_47_19]
MLAPNKNGDGEGMVIKIIASQGTTKKHVAKQLEELLGDRRDVFYLREDHPSIFLLEGPIDDETITQIRHVDGFTSVSVAN